ncbi:MFS transporter [Phytohabitans suffuscus]|uniref:MFS transporter n=1 Tax=Phytohabitans suffuscus TaxID=624315 RepID=A0A6F8YMW1_9ACTN|nr:MFS transporter [Phytohabitans suffuscus]BCB87369.1 MFS transporter [Phytohabitans suffuscus]
MYVSLRDKPAGDAPPAAGRVVARRVSSTVVLLGVVSLLTDVSSEMVASIMPLYLTAVVGLSPAAYGFWDGIYQGVSAVVRIAGGYAADRREHPKLVAVLGYGVSALSRIAMLPAQGFAAITAVTTADRLGKGLRTAPRDALIAASSPPESLGRSFGVHRALDTFGAALGPLVAFALLWTVPGSYDSVFVVSFGFATAGLAVLLLLVPNLRTATGTAAGAGDVRSEERSDEDGRSRADPRPARAKRAPDGKARVGLRRVVREISGRKLRRPLLAAGLLGLLTVGDGFIYLSLQDRDDFAALYFPLLYIGTNAVYLVLAVPFGRLADRVGRARVLIGGHLALVAGYLLAARPSGGLVSTLAVLALLGTFYAATDGVLPALISRLVPAETRGSGIAAAQTVVALARFAASLGFGILWQLTGRGAALLVVAAALLAAIPAAAWLLRGISHERKVGTA